MIQKKVKSLKEVHKARLRGSAARLSPWRAKSAAASVGSHQSLLKVVRPGTRSPQEAVGEVRYMQDVADTSGRASPVVRGVVESRL